MVNFTPKKEGKKSKIEEQAQRTASDIMDASYLTIKPDMTMDEAGALIAKHKVTGVPVVEEGKKLIGFLSQKDCMKYMLDVKYHNDLSSSVRDHMSRSVLTLHKNETLFYLMELFVKNNFQTYPVIDDGDILLGVISRTALFIELNELNQTEWYDVI
jgi:CBS domain-containing protein